MTRATTQAHRVDRLHRPSRRAAAASLVAAGLAVMMAGPATASDVRTQTIVLNPGWNAVYLEVQPEPRDVESVFQGLPLASAWTYSTRQRPVEFIQDPSEDLVNVEGWLGYFPRPRPEWFLTNLYAVDANRAYLLKIESAAPVVWNVTGRPVLRDREWVPNSFNLTGFHVDPDTPPSFGAFFSTSEAFDGQPIYRLSPSGVWELVTNPYAVNMRPGEAFWVRCEGQSEFTGPVKVSVEQGDGLRYGGGLVEQVLRIRNQASVPNTIRLRQIGGTDPVSLVYRNLDPDTGEVSWPRLPTVLNLPAEPDEEVFVRLAVRRGEFTADFVSSLIEITDNFGMRRLVSVSASTADAVPPNLKGSLRAKMAKAAQTDYAGLWVGTVRLTAVSQSQTGSAEPTPVGKPFSFRILLHVDGSGQARLLKEVIQMWQNGTLVPDPGDPTSLILDEPGRYVLITDDALIPNFEGAALRDGVPVGVRVSTAAYDFQGTSVDLTGSFGGTLQCTLVLPSNAATNPFKHKYHPDHNNLDELYVGTVEEAYAVTRRVELVFSPEDPTGEPPPDWGESVMGGTYREVMSGLHRNDIYVEGWFRVRRASTVPVLNQ